MANEQNLRPSEYKFTQDDTLKGNKASIESRRHRALVRKAFKDLLNSNITINKGSIQENFQSLGIDTKDMSLAELASMGLIVGAINGNATNFKTMLETNNEITETENTITPTLNINIVDNSKLEGVMYEENKH